MNTTTQIDITRFCELDIPHMSEPWVYQGWRYATDGRAAVRVPATGEPDSPEIGRRESINRGMLTVFSAATGELHDWPALKVCELCRGKGDCVGECPSCFGNGRCECSRCSDDHNCGECEGEGTCERSCECRDEEVRIGPCTVAKYLADRVALLPHPKYYEPTHALACIRFIFDGDGEGALMPLKRDV